MFCALGVGLCVFVDQSPIFCQEESEPTPAPISFWKLLSLSYRNSFECMFSLNVFNIEGLYEVGALRSHSMVDTIPSVCLNIFYYYYSVMTASTINFNKCSFLLGLLEGTRRTNYPTEMISFLRKCCLK